MSFDLTKEARNDAFRLWHYLATEVGEEAADRQLAKVRDDAMRLVETPTLGTSRSPAFPKRYRFFRSGNHFIVYRLDPDVLKVVAIIHAARDLETALRRRLPV